MTKASFNPASLEEIDDAKRAEWKAGCERRMAKIDALPRDVRLLVHHYGWEPVKILLDLGCRRPRQIEHAIRAIRMLGQEDEDKVLRRNGHHLGSSAKNALKP